MPKSASVLWALADQPTREAIYAAHRQTISDVIALIERDVAKTRIGTNGVAQVDVRGVVAAAFDHWDSRENDPNLHTHVVIANRVQGPDGKWRTLDSRAIHKAAVAMSERYDTILADHITTALGLEWEYRDRGPNRNPAFELAVVPRGLVDAFSRRSQAIDGDRPPHRRLRRLARAPARHGHGHPAPTAGHPVHPGAEGTPLPRRTHRQWNVRAADVLGKDPSTWAARALTPAAPEVADPLPDCARAVADEVAEQVLAVLSVKRSTWTTWNVDAEASRALKHHRFTTPAERDATVAEVVAAVGRRSVLLTPPETAPVPPAFPGDRTGRRRSGTTAPSGTPPRVCSTPRTDSCSPAGMSAVPAPRSGRGDHGAGAVPRPGGRRHHDRDVRASGRRPGGAGGVGEDPHPRGPAHRVGSQHGAGSVVGLAPSAAATEVLASSLGIGCENTAKWLVEHDAEPDRLARIDRARAALYRADPAAARSIAAHLHRLEAEVDRWRFRPGQLVILDEATLAATPELDHLAAHAQAAGAGVLLVGD